MYTDELQAAVVSVARGAYNMMMGLTPVLNHKMFEKSFDAFLIFPNNLINIKFPSRLQV